MNGSSKIIAAALVAAAAPWLVAAPAAALPVSSPMALQNAAVSSVEAVQYRRGWRSRNVGPGIVAGAVIGGLIAGATRPAYGYGPYGYGGYDGYAYAPGYRRGYVAAVPYGNEVAYCQQRFRSYDVASGTYLGFDGLRHPCP